MMHSIPAAKLAEMLQPAAAENYLRR